MDLAELNRELRNSARMRHLCDEWYTSWGDNLSQQDLIDKYFRGLDFALKHHWPSNSYIKEHFDLDLLHKNHIIIDEERSILNADEGIILGNSKVKARVNMRNSSVLYVRDKSFLHLIARNRAFVIIHLFDKSSLKVEVSDTPNVLILKHSESAHVEVPSGVRVKEEYDYLT